MAEFVLHNARCICPVGGSFDGYVHVRDGEIVVCAAGSPPAEFAGERLDAQGRRLTPGFIDLHTHGMHHYNYDRGVEDLRNAAAVLGKYGTTTVVPTLVPNMSTEMWNTLADLVRVIPTIHDVQIPGLHLEGPFVAITGAACETRDGDVSLLNELLSACQGRVTVMSIAPEVPNIIPVIARLVEAGVTPFITHTQASVAQTVAAIEAGARHATHFYDVFPVPEEVDPGVRPVGAVETILADPRATCDFICDGIHVDPMAIRAAVAAKGTGGVSLITDASFGAGLAPGVYETPWGYPVEVKPGNAPRIADPEHAFYGALAGSALTMNRGMANLLAWLDGQEADIWSMGTASPARVIGLEDRGALTPGMRADLVLWEDGAELTVSSTWVGGKNVFLNHE